jgi:photosystem II stability/assembly factor-like uncharacterized protein
VGEGGIILGTRDSGVTWNIVQPAVSVQALNAVWRTSVRQAVAVGDLGSAPRTFASGDSAVWVVNTVGSSNLYGVSFPNETVGYAVGSGGAVWKSGDSGATWDPQSPNTSSQLNDVFFIDANRGWAVGQSGVIVRTVTGGSGGSGPLAHRASQRVVRHR